MLAPPNSEKLPAPERKDGETWTNPFTGLVYRWDAEQGFWARTEERVPVPHLGEFP